MYNDIKDLELEINRYCELSICPCVNKNDIGKSFECKIFEIPLDLRAYFKQNIFKKIYEITGGSTYSIDNTTENFAKVKMRYYCNIFEIECKLVEDNVKTFDAIFTTTLKEIH